MAEGEDYLTSLGDPAPGAPKPQTTRELQKKRDDEYGRLKYEYETKVGRKLTDEEGTSLLYRATARVDPEGVTLAQNLTPAQRKGLSDAKAAEAKLTPGAAPGAAPGAGAGVRKEGPLPIGQTIQIDRGPEQYLRNKQKELADVFEARIRGERPSVAEQQFGRQTKQNIDTQLGLAAGTRGALVGAAGIQAARNVAELGGQAATEAAALRAGEQAQAEKGLVDLYSGVRDQDIRTAYEQAKMQQAREEFIAKAELDRRMANLEAELKTRQMDLLEKQQLLQASQDAWSKELGLDAAGAASEEAKAARIAALTDTIILGAAETAQAVQKAPKPQKDQFTNPETGGKVNPF